MPRVLQFSLQILRDKIDPQLESTIRPKAQGLHFIWNAILQIAFLIWFLHQDNTSTIEDLREKNSGTLGNYSRRLQDYSRISWSTFQPRDDSSTLEHFRLVELRDAQGLLAKAIKTTRKTSCSTTKYSGACRTCRMDIPGPTTPLGTRTDYSAGPWDYSTCAIGTRWCGAQGLQRNSTRLGSCTCSDPCKVLLAVHD
jgi:hypothetical protein